MTTLLEVATEKFKKSKKGVTDFSKDFQTFLIECFIHLTPASYGYQIQNRILGSLKKIQVKSSKDNCGDFTIGNWELLLCNEYLAQVMKFYEFNKYFMGENTIAPFRNVLLTILQEISIRYCLPCEIKVSYLNKNSKYYTLRNLRPYQNYTHYLIVFVDCDDSFKYKISLVNKNVINNLLTLSDMHGVKDVNIDVTNRHLGCVVNKNSYEESVIFDECNLLESNSLECVNDTIDAILKFAEESVSKLTLGEILEICPEFNDILSRVQK